MSSPIRTRNMVVLVAIALAWAVIALVANGASGSTSGAGGAAVTPALAAHYAILDRPRVAADDPPAGTVPQALAAVASSAHLATRTATGASVYVLPGGSGEVCILAVGGGQSGAGCSAADAATAGTVTLSACAPGLLDGSARVLMLVPDAATGVHEVVDGVSSPLTVANNVAVVESDRIPTVVGWTDSSGAQTRAVPGAEEVPDACATLPDRKRDRVGGD